MQYDGYLVIKYNPKAYRRGERDGARPSVRITKTAPSLDQHEVALKLNLDLPDELFQRPQLQANITVPADAVTPAVVSAEVGDNIREVIRRELGIEMTVSIVEPEAGER